jgi:hypothetical protein
VSSADGRLLHKSLSMCYGYCLFNPVFKDVAVRMHDVASHAANAWMTDLIRALIAHGKKVRTIGHEPARVWPLGRHLLPGDPEHLQRGFAQRLVKYVNCRWCGIFFCAWDIAMLFKKR